MNDVAIGLEVHVQLATSLKLFCADRNVAGAEPNTHVCPVCLGLPGALPVLDGEAVDLAVRAAVGLGCDVQPISRFERKCYFYPDLPKGYQITQHAQPLALGGALDFPFADEVRAVALRRVHLEEDAGRLLHDRFDGCTAIDLNRAGVALIEIVTEPQLRTGAEARAFLLRLRQTLRYLGVSECDMENGTLRVDANVSVGDGAPIEVKNLNSFAHVEKAITYEIERQRQLPAGERAERETRSWDPGAGCTRTLRSKESVADYRYVVDPDLPPLPIHPLDVDTVRETLPELPAARERRFAQMYRLQARDIAVLTAEPDLAAFFEELALACDDPGAAAEWTRGPVLAWLNRTGSRVDSVPADDTALLIGAVASGRLSRGAARNVFERMMRTGEAAEVAIEASGLTQVGDETAVRDWVDTVIAGNVQEVERLRAGEERVRTYLMGQIMKLSQGRADPHVAARLLAERLAQ